MTDHTDPQPTAPQKRRRRWLLALIIPAALILIGAVAIHRAEGAYFDSDGVSLHFTEEGEGTPVVLLHGFGLNGAWNWRLTRIAQRLANDFRVITLDVRGHGFSGKPHEPAAYGVELAQDIRRLLDHLEIDQAHIGGYSMGGFITLKFASLYPERTLSAAICGAGWDEIDAENAALLRNIAEAIDQHQSFDPLVETLEPDGDPSFIKATAINLAMGIFNDVEAIVNVFKTFEELAVPRDVITANRVPMLGIVGSEDPLSEQTEQLADVRPGVQLSLVDGRNHATTLIDGSFYRELRDFFLKHTPETELQVVRSAS